MVAAVLLSLLLIGDVLLYKRYWILFARRYYFLDYRITAGWMMAYKLKGDKQ